MPHTSKITFAVEGLSCASCVARLEKALGQVPGVGEVSVNLATHRAQLFVDDDPQTPQRARAASTSAGYPATPMADIADRSATPTQHHTSQDLGKRVIAAAILSLPVILLEMGAHVSPALHHLIHNSIGQQGSWLLQAILTTFLMAGPGRMFFRTGFPALARGAPDMNTLVAIGTGAAWSFSMLVTFWPALLPPAVRNVYFEAAAAIILLILLGRWLEERAKGRTGAAIGALLALQAKTARRLVDGVMVDTPIEDIHAGDVIVLRPGERVPTDGAVTDGQSHIDESMLTGEPMPVLKTTGDQITGGTLNTNGALTYVTTRVGAETTLAQIIEMVEQAQGGKLPVQALIDRVSLWFVPCVLGLAVLTVLAWLVFAAPINQPLALVAGVSVLIIACPCAMGLATPTSIMVGTGRAAEMGVLFRQGEALQVLSTVEVIAFDKTGTLTQGQPNVTTMTATSDLAKTEVLRLAAAAEQHSEHPLAQAILHAVSAADQPLPQAAGFAATAGLGISAQVEGKQILVGSQSFLESNAADCTSAAQTAAHLAHQGETVIYVAVDGVLAGVIGIADQLKPNAAAVIETLKSRGLEVVMITGDQDAAARAVGNALGISNVMSGVLPDGKMAAIKALQSGGRKTAFVGDGINDAPALAAADVGIAIGNGTDVAIEAADIVLISGDLRGVVNALTVSRKTMGNIRQNLAWAFGYNAALIPVAAGLFYASFGLLLSPIFAAGAMAASSVCVLSNALRLQWIKPANLCLNNKATTP